MSEGEGLRQTYSGVGIYPAASFSQAASPENFRCCRCCAGRSPQRALSGELHAGRWYDIGTTERLAALDAELTSAPKVS